MALSIGSKAPDFALSTKDASGVRLVKLSDNFVQTNTLLLFFPAAFTSVCTAEMCDLTEEFGTYEGLNTAVFGISGDSPFALETWANQEKIRIPLLSDYDHSVARGYGVAYDSFLPEANLPLSGVAKRSAFIVDRNGVIQYAESSDNPKQLPNFGAIQAKLKELV
jgi:glutaredoxin-dependent peroxiredoxin